MLEIRPARPGEEPRLKSLWQQVFGDSDAAVEAFFRCLPADFLVVSEADQIRSMLALTPMELIGSGGTAASAWYVYALATDPACRGRGLARRLLAETDERLRRRGADCAAVVPAEPSLHDFFGSNGFEPCFAVWEREVELRLPPRVPSRLDPAAPEEYNALRNARLTELHLDWVRYDVPSIRYQQAISRLSGGDLYAVTVAGETGCAAVERTPQGGLLCKELLISAFNFREAAARIRVQCGGADLRVRTPADPRLPPNPEVRPFGMVKWYHPAGPWANIALGYLGLGFD